MKNKNKITAAMLAFFTGFFGGQFLYLRRPGLFALFLLVSIFSATIIPTILSFIHGFMLLKMSDHEFDRKYNRDFKAYHSDTLDRRRQKQMKSYQEEYRRPARSGKKPELKPQSKTQTQVSFLKKSGIQKYKNFDINEAIGDFSKALELAPHDPSLHFNLACSYSLNENRELAFHHLKLAVTYGLNDMERILNHDDLAFVRIQPEFDSFRKSGFMQNPLNEKNPKEIKTNSENNSYQKVNENDTLLAQISQLSELRKKGVLSEEEFLFEKKKIMRQ
jgi:TM2 domain-containing membrane protein YozV